MIMWTENGTVKVNDGMETGRYGGNMTTWTESCTADTKDVAKTGS